MMELAKLWCAGALMKTLYKTIPSDFSFWIIFQENENSIYFCGDKSNEIWNLIFFLIYSTVFFFCYFPSFSQQQNRGLLNFVCTTFFNFLLKNFNFCVFFFTKSNLCSSSNQFHKKKHIEILFYFLVIFGFFNKKYI